MADTTTPPNKDNVNSLNGQIVNNEYSINQHKRAEEDANARKSAAEARAKEAEANAKKEREEAAKIQEEIDSGNLSESDTAKKEEEKKQHTDNAAKYDKEKNEAKTEAKKAESDAKSEKQKRKELEEQNKDLTTRADALENDELSNIAEKKEAAGEELTDAEREALEIKRANDERESTVQDIKDTSAEHENVIYDTINQSFATDPVTNFRLPQWGYTDFVTELDNFRKGVTSITGEPGWFYFKIFFHFDDTYGLLGTVLGNKELQKNNNTAYNFLRKRKNSPWYKSLNLGARAAMLERFVRYLSYINCATPWFFDKVSGLDKAVLNPKDLTAEKIIEISCLEDAVDMRLTTLFHLYQYVCYDEIQQKEIVPENLRKFNMSIALYHVPVRLFHTANASDGGIDSPKHMNGGDGNYSNQMSYKLFTFKGCEFDLESIGGVIPGSLDNSKPFNLGKSSFKIRYDRCFTHLMNEWEQFMLGPEGIYFDPKMLNIGSSEYQDTRLNNITNFLEHAQSNESTSPRIITSIIGENFVKYAKLNHTLGNIYNLDIRKLKQEDLKSRSSRIYLANLFDYNPILFRGLVIMKNTDPSKTVLLTSLTRTRYGTFSIPNTWASLNFGERGYRRLPDARNLSSVLNRGTERFKYQKIWYASSTGTNTEGYTNIYQLMREAETYKNQWGRLYAFPDYRQSLSYIVDSYMFAWKNVKGFWKTMLKNASNSLKSVGKQFKF